MWKTYEYASANTVEDLNLHIRSGEFVGPPVGGRSTTLPMIAGLGERSDDEIWIGDRRVDQLALRERDIAMVSQSHAHYPRMTDAQNMSFGLRPAGMERHRQVGDVD